MLYRPLLPRSLLCAIDVARGIIGYKGCSIRQIPIHEREPDILVPSTVTVNHGRNYLYNPSRYSGQSRDGGLPWLWVAAKDMLSGSGAAAPFPRSFSR